MDKKYIVPNLWRAIDVLEYLAQKPEGKTISEVTEALSIPTNSVFRILRTLASRGYVLQKHKRYEVSSKLFALGAQAIAEETLFERSLPVMREIRDELKETVLLGKLVGNKGVVLEQVPGTHPVKVIVEVGFNFNLHCSAPGKAILAFLPESERDVILKGYRYTLHTPTTISNEKAFMKVLQQVKSIGYALDLEEGDEGVRCIGSPILNSHGFPVAAIWTTGPALRLNSKMCEKNGKLLIKKATDISKSLGYLSKEEK
jgi:DNA-binding IclR family transcriptional regulator